jgi:hypothetical protein
MQSLNQTHIDLPCLSISSNPSPAFILLQFGAYTPSAWSNCDFIANLEDGRCLYRIDNVHGYVLSNSVRVMALDWSNYIQSSY